MGHKYSINRWQKQSSQLPSSAVNVCIDGEDIGKIALLMVMLLTLLVLKICTYICRCKNLTKMLMSM